jgi:hypothetical protein
MINNQEKKWSKLSMISLGLFILAIISTQFDFDTFPFVLIIGSFVLSIISLNQIKKYKLLGKSLAIISLTLSGIALVFLFFIYLFFRNGFW